MAYSRSAKSASEYKAYMDQFYKERRQRERMKVVQHFLNPPRNPWAPEDPREPIGADLLPIHRIVEEEREDSSSNAYDSDGSPTEFWHLGQCDTKPTGWSDSANPLPAVQTTQCIAEPATPHPESSTSAPPALPNGSGNRKEQTRDLIAHLSGLAEKATHSGIAQHFGITANEVWFMSPNNQPCNQAYIKVGSVGHLNKVLRMHNKEYLGKRLQVKRSTAGALQTLLQQQAEYHRQRSLLQLTGSTK